MEQIGNMKLYSFEEVKDELIGKVGTPERDEHERKVAEAVHAYHIGEAIKKARLLQNLTQEQLGERVGVTKAQISRLERGYSITIPTRHPYTPRGGRPVLLFFRAFLSRNGKNALF